MSIWLILWIGIVFVLILWWDLYALTPGLLMLAIGYVLMQQGESGWFKELLGVALAPVLGGVSFTFGFAIIRFKTGAMHKPPFLTRLVTVLAILATAIFFPLESLFPFLPGAFHNLAALRMLTVLAFLGLAFLGLAEMTVFKGFGFLLLLLTTNIVIQGIYGDLDSFMLLANIMELGALLLLTIEALRHPMWLGRQQEGLRAHEQ